MRGNIENDYHNYSKLSGLGSHFGASYLSLCGCGESVSLDLGEGTPIGLVLASPAAPLVSFSCLFGRFLEQICSKFHKDSRATNGNNHTFKKQARIQNKNTDNQSKS